MAGKQTETVEARAGELVLRLDEQRTRLRTVLDLAGRQRAAIERDDPSDLLRILAERERTFNAIELNTAAIEELRIIDDPVAIASEPVRLLLEARLRELTELAAQVMELDRADTAAAAALRDRAAAELAALSHGRRINGAYGNTAPLAASFQDREG